MEYINEYNEREFWRENEKEKREIRNGHEEGGGFRERKEENRETTEL